MDDAVCSSFECVKHSRSDTNRTGAKGFILLLPQIAALSESDAGSGVIKPASSFVIQKTSDLVLHMVPDVHGTLLVHGLRFAQRRHTRNL